MAAVPSGKALTAERMWAVIIAVVVYHELACAPGQLLSEGVDRVRLRHPILVPGFIVVTAAHLLRRLPPKADPYAWVGKMHQRLKGTK